MQYIIVLLEDNATSFCYYSSACKNNKVISYDTLQNVIKYAEKNGLFINFLFGETPLSKKMEESIENSTHIKIAPISQINRLSNAVFVCDFDGINYLDDLNLDSKPILILRIEKKHLNLLNTIYDKLFPKCSRINLIIKNIEEFTTDDFQQYEAQLKEISKKTAQAFQQELNTELSFITDRMLLTEMNNCHAGISHVTVSPIGDIYHCPAWYYDSSNPIGNINTAFEVKNDSLLKLENAPICRICDVWHCKRCYFLNQKTTLEINTPSHEQCVISHLERNASRNVLKILRKNGIGTENFSDIPAIDYLDPFEEAVEINKTLMVLLPEIKQEEILQKQTDRELLEVILFQQKELLAKINKLYPND